MGLSTTVPPTVRERSDRTTRHGRLASPRSSETLAVSTAPELLVELTGGGALHPVTVAGTSSPVPHVLRFEAVVPDPPVTERIAVRETTEGPNSRTHSRVRFPQLDSKWMLLPPAYARCFVSTL